MDVRVPVLRDFCLVANVFVPLVVPEVTFVKVRVTVLPAAIVIPVIRKGAELLEIVPVVTADSVPLQPPVGTFIQSAPLVISPGCGIYKS